MGVHSIHADRPPSCVEPRPRSGLTREYVHGPLQSMDRPRKPGAIRELLRLYREHEGRSFWADLAIVGGFLVAIVLAIVAVSPFEVVNVGAGM